MEETAVSLVGRHNVICVLEKTLSFTNNMNVQRLNVKGWKKKNLNFSSKIVLEMEWQVAVCHPMFYLLDQVLILDQFLKLSLLRLYFSHLQV